MLKKRLPDFKIMDNAQSYIKLNNNENGIFLIHGYTGSPAEMVPFAKKFENKGFSVYCPRLAGHGTNIKDFVNTGFMDWYQSALIQYLEFRKRVKNTYIIGLSMGGQIAAYLDAVVGCEKIALFSTPYDIVDPRMKYAKYIWPIMPKIKKTETKPNVFDENGRKLMVNYDDEKYNFVKPAGQLYRSFKLFHKFIRRMRAPLLIVQSELDPVVNFKSPQKIFNKSKSISKQLNYLKKSSHVITLDYEVEQLFEMTYKFFFE